MKSLYQIESNVASILEEHMDVETGEISPAGELLLNGLEADKEELWLAMATVAKDLLAHAAAIKEVIKERSAASFEAASRADKILRRLQLEVPKGQSLKDPQVEILWRQSPGKVVVTIEEEALELYEQPPKAVAPQVDKAELRKVMLAHARGECSVFAYRGHGQREVHFEVHPFGSTTDATPGYFAVLAKPREVKIR
jgi:hypothetical protein